MSGSSDKGKNGDIDFSWGMKRKRGGTNKDVQFYESFTYDGVEYFLYDSVYLFKEGEPRPYIGKLIKIWEHSNKARKVKVLWFFYPSEISNYLGDEKVLENELFLASGIGKGLANINPLEAIAGKCNVVCISKDERNRQPTVEELKMAHYVFYRTFDVQNFTISDELDEKIAMVEVKFLLNKNDIKPPDLAKVDSGNVVENPLISVKDTLMADKAVEHDAGVSLFIKDDKLKCCPPDNHDIEGPASSSPVVAIEKKLISAKDTAGAPDDIEYDASIGSLLVRDDKGSKEKGDAAGVDSAGSIPLPASEQALVSCPEIRMRSPDRKQTDSNEVTKVVLNVRSSENSASQKAKVGESIDLLDENKGYGLKSDVDSGKDNVKGSVSPVTDALNEKSKLTKDIRRPISAVSEGKSDGRPSKKLKLDDTASVSSDNNGISTHKHAVVSTVSNKASQLAGAATVTIDRGKVSRELGDLSNRLPRKLKSNSLMEDQFNDKLHKASVKQSKDQNEDATVSIATNKAPPPDATDAETDDKSKLARELVGISNSLLEKQKSNGMIENRSNDKLRKAAIKQSRDREKSAIVSIPRNKACEPGAETNDGGKLGIGLDGTSNGFCTKLKSNSRLEDKSKDKLHKASIKQSSDVEIEAYGCVKEVTRRPPDRSKWFTASHWDERMKEAHDRERLVLLQNLDPAYTSCEVENIVWHGFGESCTAKMVQQIATSSPNSGEALVIFRTREAAEKVIRKLDQGCLMLPDGRPLVGSIGVTGFPGKQSPFPGHLVIDKLRLQMQREAREAMSTSHSSQPNTLQYEMAMEWRLLQERSELWWNKLHKQQRGQMKNLKVSLKSK